MVRRVAAVGLVALAASASAFTVPISSLSTPSRSFLGAATQCRAPQARSALVQQQALQMSDTEDLKRLARAARKAGPTDRVVELKKPLGLVLQEDENRDVVVVEVRKGGNADKSGKVMAGDKIAFLSATFGDEVWSARGTGLSRVQNAIKVRQGELVTLVLETTKESQAKAKKAADVAASKKATQEDELAKRDRLLKQLDADTAKRTKGFFGLF